MPHSKKDSQRIRQTYNLTQGHREPAKKASARLCALQLSVQPWTTRPLLVILVTKDKQSL